MGRKINHHPFYTGNKHGRLSFGAYRVSNETAAVMLQSGQDAGRHYTVMQSTGDADKGTKGSTTSVCPGTHTVKAGKDIVNYTLPSTTPNNIPAIFYEAENGDIVLSAPRGRIKIVAEDIELISTGFDGKSGVISLTANEKILLNSQTIDIQSTETTKIFSEKTVECIGKGLMNIYGGLVKFSDRTTKGGKPSKTCYPDRASSDQAVDINEERNR